MGKSRKVETIRTIIWDLDKTLWNYHDDQLMVYCDILGIEESDELKEQFYNMLLKFDVFFKNRKVTYPDLIYYVESMIPYLKKLNITAADFLNIPREANVTILNEDAKKVLSLMQEAGKRNIVLTDWIRNIQLRLLQKYDLIEHIEQVFTVDDRYLKAHKNAKRGIITPGMEDSYIIIGDSLNKDILFAHNAGIKSVWYNPNELKNETRYEPTFEVASLLEITNFIK